MGSVSFAGGGGGGGGNGGNGGGGGYGGGILTIIADAVNCGTEGTPHFVVSGQKGGLGFQSGQNGEGGMLIIQARHYAPSSYHWSLGSSTYGSHAAGTTNGGHGIVTGDPQKVFLLSSLLSPCPVMLSQPQSQAVAVGSDVMLSMQATGDAPLSFQWRKDGTNLADGGRISGATSNVLSIANAQTNDAGAYSVLVTNACGAATSSNAVLVVSVPPLQFVPGSARISAGQFTFTLQSRPGLSFEIQASTNLVYWATVATLTNSSGTTPFTTPTAGFTRRFYRARQLP
jgi:hypothetical protein